MMTSIQNINEVDSPSLVVIKEQVVKNISHAIQMVGEIARIRPHVKTHKSPDVTKLMLAAGISKFKCATIAEAEMLGKCSAPDVLLAYQPVGPKIERFISVIKQYPNTQYSCLVDDMVAAENMAALFFKNDLTVPVFIDINIGQNRTGISPNGAAELYEACYELNGIKPVGLQGYDGHIRDLHFGKRTAECDEAFKLVEQVKSQIIDMGFDPPIIVAGGSPTFPIHAMRKEVECSPGTFVYWDKGYSDLCPEQPFQPAAFLLTRVISRPNPTLICLDLGHKSVAAENEIGKRIFFPEHPNLIPISQSEEHLVMDARLNHGFNIGDVLIGIPYHICPTVAMYEKVYVVENDRIIDEWKTTARNRFV